MNDDEPNDSDVDRPSGGDAVSPEYPDSTETATAEPTTEGTASEDRTDDEMPLPPSVIDEVIRLTRDARRGDDDARSRREALLDDRGYASRLREADDVLVCYPDDWLSDGTVDPERVDTAEAVEISLDGGEWDAVAQRNRSIAATVRERHGPIHGETAEAFAAYMNNHHAKPIPAATTDEVKRFRADFFPRNAWPSDEQRSVLDESIELILETADELADD